MPTTAPAAAMDENGTKCVARQKAGSNQILVADSTANSNSWTLLGTSEGGPEVVGGSANRERSRGRGPEWIGRDESWGDR
jgi:hypothetical protein